LILINGAFFFMGSYLFWAGGGGKESGF